MLYISKVIVDKEFNYENLIFIDRLCSRYKDKLIDRIHFYINDVEEFVYIIDGDYYMNNDNVLKEVLDVFDKKLKLDVRCRFNVCCKNSVPLLYNNFLDYLRDKELCLNSKYKWSAYDVL